MALKVYLQEDCDLNIIRGKKVAILGFGSQGKAHALNLKDSGVSVIIGLYEGSKSSQSAKELGFEVLEVAQAVKKSEVIAFMLPDELHAEVFTQEVKPHLTSQHTLVFCHGFSVHYNQVQAPQGVGVIMVAPKGTGASVRSEFEAGRGIPNLIAIEQENSQQNAKALALSYSAGIGGARSFILETTFAHEAQTDLFGEQAVLCGGVRSLVLNAFETLTEAGYPEELAYFECLHELKLVTDLIHKGGLSHMHKSISNTAEYGMITSGERIIDAKAKQAMREILKDIQNGSFAKDFILEKQSGYVRLESERKNTQAHPIEKVGAHLRNLIKKSQL